ncbi:MAG: AarF/ABC1/UbiB kinase family protein, partial [Desulfobacterales bacterium]|nr:AarF/ABC1/UbiB kinase family protein [Desulfobacterales bacterium]
MKKCRRISDEVEINPDPDATSCSEACADVKIDSRRYRKVRWFFAKVMAQIIVWDIVFSLPILKWLRPAPLRRWSRVAKGFKEMAMEMGGVLIKLGQFLSIRLDILPPEVIRELTDLQDEVAPEPFEKIAEQLEEDLENPVSELFDSFSREPLGAASLAQAHLAILHGGKEVVVKILRPGVQ